MTRKKNRTTSVQKASNMGKSNSTKRVISVSAMNDGQKEALRTISRKQISIISGTPGTGKTHIAVGWALQEFINGRFERIILTRPVVEAGESLGFLPGDAEQKIAPYMMPMNEILTQYLSQEDLRKMIDEKKIIVLPIAYMRGATFKKAVVVADECQNMTIKQIHLLMTRLGSGSKIILTGDIGQSDLGPKKEMYNGLKDAINRLANVKGVGMVHLGHESCVRENLVNEIDEAYRSKPEEPSEETGLLEAATYEALLGNGEFDDLIEDAESDWEECDCDDDDPDCDCEEYEQE